MRFLRKFESQRNYLYSTPQKTSKEDLIRAGYPHRFKFKLDDYVRFVRLSHHSNVIFQIKVIDSTVGEELIYKIQAEPEYNTWASEKNLELVPDYEVKAKNYNL